MCVLRVLFALFDVAVWGVKLFGHDIKLLFLVKFMQIFETKHFVRVVLHRAFSEDFKVFRCFKVF